MSLKKIENFLMKIDSYRDRYVGYLMKNFCPSFITPNHLSWLRGIIGLIIFFLLFFLKTDNRTLILSLFAIGAITDFIDGPLARATHRTSQFGAILDSTTDRILIIPIILYSLFPSFFWLLITLLLMELLNALSALYYKSQEIYLESNIFGKIKMTLMCPALFFVLVSFPNPPSPIFIYVLWSTVFLSIISIVTRIQKLKT